MKVRRQNRPAQALPELDVMRRQVEELIAANYGTTEAFCFDKDLNKGTLSNFLNGRKDFQISTLSKIARALGKKLVIRIE